MSRRLLPWVLTLPLLLAGCSMDPASPAPSAAMPIRTAPAAPTPSPSPTPSPTPSPAPTPAPTAAPLLRYVASDGIRLRTSPRHGAGEAGILSRGTQVTETDREGRWAYVRSGALAGWLPDAHLADAPPAPIPEAVADPAIRVHKDDRLLLLLDGGTTVAAFPIGLGFAPMGHKEREGDGRTPEGRYYVCTRNGASKFYLSLGLSYPNAEDAAAGLAAGTVGEEEHNRIADALSRGARPPWDTALGGAIMIHGHGSACDWTAGCIAVEDTVMDLLWQHCPIGTPVTVFP